MKSLMILSSDSGKNIKTNNHLTKNIKYKWQKTQNGIDKNSNLIYTVSDNESG